MATRQATIDAFTSVVWVCVPEGLNGQTLMITINTDGTWLIRRGADKTQNYTEGTTSSTRDV